MTRRIRLSLIVILATVAVCLQAWAQPFCEDIQRILDRQKITVAILAVDYPPFFMTGADGRLLGFDVQLVNNIAQELDVKVEFLRTATTFDGVVRQVAEKQADLGISVLSITPDRAQMVYFSTPYVIVHSALLVNRRLWLVEHSKFPGQDIKNATAALGVVRGTSHVRMARKTFPRATLKEYASLEEEVAAVKKGECLAVLEDDFVIRRYLKQNPGAAVDLHMHVLKDQLDYIGIAVRPDSPHLLAWLNAYLLTNGPHLTGSEGLDALDKTSTPGTRIGTGPAR